MSDTTNVIKNEDRSLNTAFHLAHSDVIDTQERPCHKYTSLDKDGELLEVWYEDKHGILTDYTELEQAKIELERARDWLTDMAMKLQKSRAKAARNNKEEE